MAKARRILALVLTLATVFTLFVGVTAFATEETAATTTEAPAAYDPAALVSFPDIGEANINYDLALQFFAKVGLLQGTDGQMQPIATMTRAQAATIIARLMLGVADADARPQVNTGFADVTANEAWASGYIKYVTDAGIMKGKVVNANGVGNQFAPNDTMSIAEWEIVMLRIAGYGQANEFTGEDWAYNANYWAKDRAISSKLVYAGTAAAPGKTAVIYEDYMTPITREQAYAFIWNLLWNVKETSWQYGTYREDTSTTGTTTGSGNTGGKLVAETLGFGRGWLEDDDGFKDIVGEVYVYSKAKAGSYAERRWTRFAGASVENAFYTHALAVFTTDLTAAEAEGRIKEVVFPIGPSTEQVRTAVRNLVNNTTAGWSNPNFFVTPSVHVNGSAGGQISTASFDAYLDGMPDREPAFGYEAEVRVWAVGGLGVGTNGNLFGWLPYRAAVKLPVLTTIGDAIKDDPYTHIVNETGLEFDVLEATPINANFSNRTEQTLSMVTSTPGYYALSALAEGTYAVVYPIATAISPEPGTITTGANVLTGYAATIENTALTGKRTGYLRLEGEDADVREATWLVGQSPALDGGNYTFYRDENGTVLGTNIIFVGNNPFRGIMMLKNVDIVWSDSTKKATGGTDTLETAAAKISKLVVTASLLDYGTTTTFEVAGSSIRNMVSGSNNDDVTTAINYDVTQHVLTSAEVNADNIVALENRFFRYTRSGAPENAGYNYRLSYLLPNQFSAKTPTVSLVSTAAAAPLSAFRSATYIWTEGYNLDSSISMSGANITTAATGGSYGGKLENGANRMVQTYTEEISYRAATGWNNNTVWKNSNVDFENKYTTDSGHAYIYKLSNNGQHITDVGVVDPYEVAAPRVFGLFTGKLTDYSNYQTAEVLVDGKIVTYNVDYGAFNNDRPGVYNIVQNYDAYYNTIEQREVGNVLNLNGVNNKDSEDDDVYTVLHDELESSEIRAVSDLYPWALKSAWRDIMEYGSTMAPEYTATLGSERAYVVYTQITDTAGSSESITDLVNDGSTTTQAWIIPDRNYIAADVVARLGLGGGTGPVVTTAPGTGGVGATVGNDSQLDAALKDPANAGKVITINGNNDITGTYSIPAGIEVVIEHSGDISGIINVASGAKLTAKQDIEIADLNVASGGSASFEAGLTIPENGSATLNGPTTVAGKVDMTATGTALTVGADSSFGSLDGGTSANVTINENVTLLVGGTPSTLSLGINAFQTLTSAEPENVFKAAALTVDGTLVVGSDVTSTLGAVTVNGSMTLNGKVSFDSESVNVTTVKNEETDTAYKMVVEGTLRLVGTSEITLTNVLIKPGATATFDAPISVTGLLDVRGTANFNKAVKVAPLNGFLGIASTTVTNFAANTTNGIANGDGVWSTDGVSREGAKINFVTLTDLLNYNQLQVEPYGIAVNGEDATHIATLNNRSDVGTAIGANNDIASVTGARCVWEKRTTGSTQDTGEDVSYSNGVLTISEKSAKYEYYVTLEPASGT